MEVPIAQMKPGRNKCSPCVRMRDNLYNAAKRQDQLEWFNAVTSDPKQWKKLKNWYKRNCADAGKNKPKTFKVLDYVAVVRNEQQHIHDGVIEMMHLVAFQHWASKPKNMPPKGFSSDEAKTEFNRRQELPETIVDFNGPTAEFRSRIGVQVKTLVIDRNLHSKGKEMRNLESSKKNATEQDMQNIYGKLFTNFDHDLSGGAAALSRS